MRAKEYLMQVREADEKLNRRLRQRDELAMMVYGISAVRYDKDRVKGGNIPGDDNRLDKLMDLDNELIAEAKELAELKKRITEKIERVDNPLYAEILFRRYVQKKSLDRIAKELNYSYAYVRHQHGAALKFFEKTQDSTQ